MKKLAIFGGTGMTGICVVQEALAMGHTVKLLLRNPSNLPSEYHNKVEIIKGNVINAEDVSKTIENVDAVIVALGTRNNLEPTTEMSRGLENIVKSMKANNIKPISVCLSAFLFYEPGKVPPMFKNINEEHERMLNIIKSSGLDYVAVFPPHIADNPKTEYRVKYGASPGGRVISKYELANFLVTSLDNSEHFGKIVGICSVSSLPKEDSK
ncbi:hypothetical protein RUM43_007287 [Polyplax serrata]|uniref:NAD(P)-binding domain-containing protein n=1 Tax=Polyplax serrata TaxID=468196 RepID=A0AAN8S7R9_POLSC